MRKKIVEHAKKIRHLPKKIHGHLYAYWHKNWWHKALIITVAVVVGLFASMYGIAQWYIYSQRNEQLKMGVSFIPAYAESLGLDAKQTMDALIYDVGVRRFRLVSYWDQLEPTDGQYDFSSLDWQFQKAEAAHAKVSLSLGLRQPRWPECHLPTWAQNLPNSVWQPKLNDFIAATVNRYKNSPALDSYQLENEYFLRGFGSCTNFDRQRLISEYNLVKSLDPNHTLIVVRSNNAQGIPLGQPQPDEYGISIYKRVWSPVIGRYIEYPFPAWYYGFLAGLQLILTGRNMIIHELQAEAWPPNGETIPDAPLSEQNKSLNAQRLEDRIEYGKATGMHEIYLWGAEYWYYRYTVLHDPSLWDVGRSTFKNQNASLD